MSIICTLPLPSQTCLNSGCFDGIFPRMNRSDSPPKKVRLTRRNITIPTVLFEKADQLYIRQGYDGLSDYVQSCLRRDTSSEHPSTSNSVQISQATYKMAEELVKQRGYRDVEELVADLIRRDWDARRPPPIDRIDQSAQDLAQLARSHGEAQKP